MRISGHRSVRLILLLHCSASPACWLPPIPASFALEPQGSDQTALLNEGAAQTPLFRWLLCSQVDCLTSVAPHDQPVPPLPGPPPCTLSSRNAHLARPTSRQTLRWWNRSTFSPPPPLNIPHPGVLSSLRTMNSVNAEIGLESHSRVSSPTLSDDPNPNMSLHFLFYENQTS